MTVLAIVFILAGVFFLVVSCIGILRLPDFYARTHAVGKSETLGAMLLIFGLALYQGFSIISLKILFVVVFILLANPAATHAMSRAALRAGLEPWTKNKKKEK